jgi:hypothetical protein
MREKQSTLVHYGLAPFHGNFPWLSRLLDGDGYPISEPYSVIIAGLPRSYNAPELNILNFRAIGYYQESSYALGASAGVGATASLSGVINVPAEPPILSSGTSYTIQRNMHFSVPQCNISLQCESSVSYNPFGFTGSLCELTANFNFQKVSEISLFRAPLCFTTAESYCYTYDSPTVRKAGSLISSEIQNLYIDTRDSLLPISGLSTKNSTSTSGGSTGTTSTACSITGTLSTDWINYKLLTRDDWLTCIAAVTIDEALYDSLSSPTIEEALANGGAEYWGIFKQTRAPFSSLDISYTLSANVNIAGASTGTSVIFNGGVDYRNVATPTDIIVDSSNSYSREKESSGQASAEFAPDYNCPSIILAYT